MNKATQAAIDFGFEKMELNRIGVSIMPRNKRSLRMIENLGFKRVGCSGNVTLTRMGTMQTMSSSRY